MKQASSVSRLGNLLRAPAVAGFVMFGLGLGSVLIEAQPALAQLPPVNMGKFVHQPGDNQYSAGTQGERHGGGGGAGGYQVVRPTVQQAQGGWVPVHRNKPDISLEPIVCDEPVPHAGFPPIPETLELPGIRGGGAFAAIGGSSYGGGGGGVGSGGSSPGLAPPPPSSHQGYNTFTPGAFQKGSTTGKGANLYQRPQPTEQYASGDGAARPSGSAQTQNQLNRLGKEPALSAKASADAAPEAPQAVSINQSTTQDLSLPDDQNPNGQKKKSKNQAGRALQRMGNRMTSRMYGMMNSMPIQMPAMK